MQSASCVLPLLFCAVNFVHLLYMPQVAVMLLGK